MIARNQSVSKPKITARIRKRMIHQMDTLTIGLRTSSQFLIYRKPLQSLVNAVLAAENSDFAPVHSALLQGSRGGPPPGKPPPGVPPGTGLFMFFSRNPNYSRYFRD